LTRAEWNTFEEEKHAARLALSRQVQRGELTPAQANRAASIFAQVPSISQQPIDFAADARRLMAASRPKHHD
jgi:hypothetical protein